MSIGTTSLGTTGTADTSATSSLSSTKGLAVAGKITGSLLNAYSAYSTLEQQEYASKYNKSLIDSERTIANVSYNLEKSRVEKVGKRLLSTQRSVISKSGLEFSGSNVEVMQTAVEDIEMDLFTIEYNRMVTNAQHQSQIDQLTIEQEYASAMKIPAAISTFIGGLL